jgi:hypothetical protein
MATVPLPDNPSIRVRLIGNKGTGTEWGNRLYFNYSGTAPDGAQCTTLAGDIAAAWNTNLASIINNGIALEEVDVLDITTAMGASGQWSGTHNGTYSGTQLPEQVANNVEFNIAERYRGGKPRIYLPPPADGALYTASTWTSAFVSASNTAVDAFFAAVVALSVSPFGTLSHVVLSYYHGYNTTSPPWRGPGYKYPPKYRSTALSLPIAGYSTKVGLGSQKRRRTSTSP